MVNMEKDQRNLLWRKSRKTYLATMTVVSGDGDDSARAWCEGHGDLGFCESLVWGRGSLNVLRERGKSGVLRVNLFQ